MNEVLILVLLIILLLAALFVVPQWRLKRAVPQVIRVFREHNALGAKSAQTLDELGLRPRSMVEGMLKGRDFRKYALSALMKAEIIRVTEDGKLYLLEDKLMASGFGKGSKFLGR